MSIEDRSLAGVETLVARYRKTEHRLAVTRAEDGALAFVLADGRSFTSPSAAGSAVMGGIACNGWRFWSPLDETAGTAVVEPHSADATTKTAKASTKAVPARTGKTLRRVPNQRGVPEGEVRWFCAACMDGFLAPYGETPTTCPAGHSNAA